MKIRRLASISVGVIALAIAVGVLGTGRAAAVNPQPLPPHYFPMIGLAPGQMARVSASNAVAPDGNPCEQERIEPLTVEIMFVGEDGSPLVDPTTGAPVQSTETVAPCGSAVLELDADRFLSPTAGTPGGQLKTRAIVVTKPTDLPVAAAVHRHDPLITGLEVIDKATGKTKVSLCGIIAILIG
jgi:hypothetical protein